MGFEDLENNKDFEDISRDGNDDNVEDTLSDLLKLKDFFKKETFDWLVGDKNSKPEDIKKLGDDFGNKINWFIGLSVLKQYSRLPKMVDWVCRAEERLMDEHDPTLAEIDDVIKMYNAFTKDINNVMEFARKFVVQNKELFSDNSDFFDRHLYEKIKALPTDLIRDYLMLFSIVESKGHNWLKTIIAENQ